MGRGARPRRATPATRKACGRCACASRNARAAGSVRSRCSPSRARTGSGPRSRSTSLMQLFLDAIDREVEDLHKNKVRLRFIGDRHALSVKLQARMAASEELTAANPGLKLQVAVSYGGRWDIVQAARRLAAEVASGALPLEAIDEDAVRARAAARRDRPIRISSSAPAAIIASAISCCGISRTPSCTSAKRCGRISTSRISKTRSPRSPAVSGASA